MNRPHVVVLMADQLRRDVLGCYGGGHSASPNIDALAGECAALGAHTINCPLCVPSRISMVTGAWPHVNGAIVNGWDEPERPYGTCRDVRTLYEVLAEGGYRVEHLGVDHLRCDPPVQGRHERIRFQARPDECHQSLRARGLEVDYSDSRSPTPDYIDGRLVMRHYTNPNTIPWPGPAEEFLDPWITDRIVETIEQASPAEPLALMGNFWLPHPPLSCPEPYFSMYDPDEIDLPETVGRWYEGQSPMQLVNLPGHVAAGTTAAGWRKAWAVYLGMVRLMDEGLGRIVAALKARGLWDDALVVFTADHGEMLGCHRLFQKMCMYESAIRVPMLVKPPAADRSEGGTGCSQPVFAPGVREQLTQHLDVAATICDYAGLEVMPGSAGRSFRAVVEDPAAAGLEEVFSEFNGNSGRGFQQRAIVTPTHKYIHNHGYAPELYDLRADPAETVNLCQADAPPPRAKALRDRLRQWMHDTGDYIHMPD